MFQVKTEGNLEIMLKISQSPLPQSSLSYIAFRVAFRETLERVSLNLQYPMEPSTPFGFLCQVPFLQEVAPAVQLDLLASTWSKHVSGDVHQSNMVDESIVYAACETTAQFIENEPQTVTHLLYGGPLESKIPVNTYLARELRSLYLSLPNDGDFLIVSQFLDMDPEDAIDQKLQMGIDPNRMSTVFEALGRWHVSPEISKNLRGLLSDLEIEHVSNVLRTLSFSR